MQIHTNYDVTITYKFVYFLLKPIARESLQRIQAKDRKYVIIVKYSDKLVNWIQSCTDKEIEKE